MDDASGIEQFVNELPIFDGHEHTLPEGARLAQAPLDPLAYLTRYVVADMVTAGALWQEIETLRDTGVDLEERATLFHHWWQPTRATAFARALSILARDLFNVEDLDSTQSILRLAEQLQASCRPGWYKQVFQKAGIECAVVDRTSLDGLDSLVMIDRELFLPVARYDPFIYATSRADLLKLEALSQTRIHSLDDFEAVLRDTFERNCAQGAVGVKFALAYHRTLEIDFVARHPAETIFNRMFADLGEGISWREAKPLQDYLIHFVIRLAAARGLPIQFHTGVLYPEVKGHGNRLTNANPALLLNLLLHYRDVPFVLFHAGIPYINEFVFLAKSYPNVYADLSWTYILSPTLARQTLHQLIEAVPANKVIGFGGDYIFIEGTYAHAVMAREQLARVLNEKLAERYLRAADAEFLARHYLYENAHGLYANTKAG